LPIYSGKNIKDKNKDKDNNIKQIKKESFFLIRRRTYAIA